MQELNNDLFFDSNKKVEQIHIYYMLYSINHFL